MINLTREEAQQVLDALKPYARQTVWVGKDSEIAKCDQNVDAAIETLRARLSAPEPEPVAKREGCSVCGIKGIHACLGYRWEEGRTPPSVTFAAPPQREWQGLTEGETVELALGAFALPEFSLETRLRLQRELANAMNAPDSRLMVFAASIEAKLKEKNT